MDKPKKKIVHYSLDEKYKYGTERGYNQAIDDYETYHTAVLEKLADEREILKIIGGFSYPSVIGIPVIDADKFIDLAKALSTRIKEALCQSEKI